jgi:hypothetical protein
MTTQGLTGRRLGDSFDSHSGDVQQLRRGADGPEPREADEGTAHAEQDAALVLRQAQWYLHKQQGAELWLLRGEQDAVVRAGVGEAQRVERGCHACGAPSSRRGRGADARRAANCGAGAWPFAGSHRRANTLGHRPWALRVPSRVSRRGKARGGAGQQEGRHRPQRWAGHQRTGGGWWGK